MKKETVIRIITFCAAAALISSAAAYKSHCKSAAFERQIKAYEDIALYNLIDATDRMKDDISSLKYGKNGAALAETASRIYADSISAEAGASALPLSESRLLEYDKLLNRAGDFSLYLLKSYSDGAPLKENDLKTLEKIAAATEALNNKLLSAKSLIDSKEITYGGLGAALSGLDFSDISALYYDGAYSDGAQNVKPVSLLNESAVLKDEAQKVLEKYVNEPSSYLYTSNGDIPVFGFSLEKGGIAEISRNGAHLVTLSRENESPYGEKGLTAEKAKEIFLNECKKLSLPDMVCRRVNEENGVYKAELIPRENGVYIYPDTVKMTISAHDGKLLSVNTREYLLNHAEREINLPDIIPDGATPALLQTDGKNETLCFEEISDGYLIYSGAENGLCRKTRKIKDTETLFSD